MFNNDISDPKLLTFSVRHTPQKQHPHGKAQLRKDFRHVNNETLNGGIMSELSLLDPSPTHPDTILDQYTFAVNTELDEYTSAILRQSCKRSTPRWYCADIYSMRKLHRHSENVCQTSGLEIHWQIHVDHRNALSNEICKSKIEYY